MLQRPALPHNISEKVSGHKAANYIDIFHAGSMKHAIMTDLAGISPLIEKVREINGLKERTPFHFYHSGVGVLHFHTDSGELYADVVDTRICMGDISNPNAKAMDLVFNTLIQKISDMKRKKP